MKSILTSTYCKKKLGQLLQNFDTKRLEEKLPAKQNYRSLKGIEIGNSSNTIFKQKKNEIY